MHFSFLTKLVTYQLLIESNIGGNIIMKFFQIRSLRKKHVLFEGHFLSFKACVETAIHEKADLTGADLRHKNLQDANLDAAHMPHADFTGTNMAGANLSECVLNGAILCNAALYNTCMAYSDLRDCDFSGAAFGATDIAGSLLSGSTFTTLSCFTLDFKTTRGMNNCRFVDKDGTSSHMSRPPVVIYGLAALPLVLLDRHIRCGHALLGHGALATA
jgi:hypothetical protein